MGFTSLWGVISIFLEKIMIENLINQAFDMGLQAQSDVITYVTQKTLASNPVSGVMIMDEMVSKDNFCKKATDLAAKVSRLPRGHYGLLSFMDGNKTYWKAFVSDGTGCKLKPEQFALHSHKPSFNKVLADMIAGEVIAAAKKVTEQRTVSVNLRIIEQESLHEGDIIKNVKVPGYKAFSRATVEHISDTGEVHLTARYRGSPRQIKVLVPASHVQIAH
jgi:hypothetical protein